MKGMDGQSRSRVQLLRARAVGHFGSSSSSCFQAPVKIPNIRRRLYQMTACMHTWLESFHYFVVALAAIVKTDSFSFLILSVAAFLYFDTASFYVSLTVLNSLHKSGQPQTHRDSPDSVSQVTGLKVCITCHPCPVMYVFYLMAVYICHQPIYFTYT